MTFDEFSQVVAEVETTERRANDAVQRLAQICAGRLRVSKVSGYVLAQLKQELRDFDMRTHTWRNS